MDVGSMLFKEKKLFNFKKYGLVFLNLTQFSVVLVDNIFKLIIAFFLIDLGGKEQASQVLSLVGAVYVIPFLLLSSLGGSLADRFSKRTITIIIKCLGGLILLSALYIFYVKSAWGCYVLLFLLSTQSAIFGPSKYGMIPELVPHQEISKANGIITSFTYFAIIIGTFLGSFLSEFFHKNYFKVLLVTFCFSLMGIISSFLIPKTQKISSGLGTNLGVFKQTFEVISHYPKKAHLGIAMIASCFFLLMGGFTQLAIIPFSINVLNKTEFIGGYLFLTTAMGIAIGSQLVGKLSKNGPRLSFTAIGGLVLSVMMILLGLFATSIKGSIICLVVLGISGGFYIVPLDAFIQVTALPEHRGRILGINNLLGFTGVLAASGFLYLLSHIMNFRPDKSFIILGLFNLGFMMIFLAKTSDCLLASWLSSRLLKKVPLTIIPSHINFLIVPKANFSILSSIIITKKRVRILKDSAGWLSQSRYLIKNKNQDLLYLLNQEMNKDELIIIEKSFIDFDLKELEGQTGEIEEVKTR